MLKRIAVSLAGVLLSGAMLTASAAPTTTQLSLSSPDYIVVVKSNSANHKAVSKVVVGPPMARLYYELTSLHLLPVDPVSCMAISSTNYDIIIHFSNGDIRSFSINAGGCRPLVDESNHRVLAPMHVLKDVSAIVH